MEGSWYDESTQSVYVDTDQGLLVLGPKNTYLLPFYDVENVQFSNDGITHITGLLEGTTEALTYDQVFYKKDGFEVVPIELETSFYGIGSKENGNIDRYDVVLFNDEEDSPAITATGHVTSITDIATIGADVKKEIKSPDWDSVSHSVLWSIVPSIQKGQGLRLHVTSPITIQSITAHVSSMGTGTLSKFNS